MLQSFPANMDPWAHQHKLYKLVNLWLYFLGVPLYFGLQRPLIVRKVKVKE